MLLNQERTRRGLTKQASGTISNAGRHVLGSLDRVGSSSTFGSDKDILFSASTSSRGSSKAVNTPILDYYKNRDRHPYKINKASKFAPPGMNNIMTPIIKKSIDEDNRLYSSVGNGNKYTTFTPRTYGSGKINLEGLLHPNTDKRVIADAAVYTNGDKNTFNDSHFYLGFSSTKRKELASTFKLPKSYEDEMYKDTESVNGLRDKPNHVDNLNDMYKDKRAYYESRKEVFSKLATPHSKSVTSLFGLARRSYD